MFVPALLQNVPESGLIVGGLTLLDRLMVTLHRAGAASLTSVSSEPLPSLQRTRALRIPYTVSENQPEKHPGMLDAALP